MNSGSLHVTEVLEGVPHHAVDVIKVVHEAPPVHLAGELGEVPADPGVEAGQLGGVWVVQARDLPVREVATKQDVGDTLDLQF